MEKLSQVRKDPDFQMKKRIKTREKSNKYYQNNHGN